MKAVLLTGAGIAVADGTVLGVALGVGSTSVAVAALAVGLASAFVLGWLTPAASVLEPPLVTLGTRPTPEPAEPEPEPAPLPLPVPAAAEAAPELLPDRAPVARHAMPTPAAA
ncbi:hypothetical protein [Xylanimonas protaetiae]|uniref:Uncharacterized protein n=1 Tax=Xylanimonas protaetiae TaxID=2509457 RepID=A0A4P6FFC7_9MICO|nr:hypothetical protein [Xylanimonas protaetiae]QAY69298.1 hypothetical protein ET471_03975 [Xylanimonas protaetiae]